MEYKQEFYEKKDPVPNRTGIPNEMKQRFENKSGLSFDDVRVHYNSGRPVQLRALAYTQGSHVYIAPGQEKHLPHELGHVVQQKQGRVHADSFLGKNALNTDPVLEAEADVIGQTAGRERFPEKEGESESKPVIQRFQPDGTLDKDDERQEDVGEKVDGYTLHHIVPVNVLKGMWNTWIGNNTWKENMEKICDYFEGMVNRDPDGKLKNTMEKVKDTRKLMLQVAANKMQGRAPFEDVERERFLEALGLMQWMPRNFVVGPMVKKEEGKRNPDHDPKDKFDIAGAAVAADAGSAAFAAYNEISPATRVPDEREQYMLYGNALEEGYQSLKDEDKREIYIGKLQAVTEYVREFGSELTKNMGQDEQRKNDYEAAEQKLKETLDIIAGEELKPEDINEYGKFQANEKKLEKIANDMKEARESGYKVKDLTDQMKQTVINWEKAKYVIKAAMESAEKSKETIGEDPITGLTGELKGCLDEPLKKIEGTEEKKGIDIGTKEIKLDEQYGRKLNGLSERAQELINTMEGYVKDDSDKETPVTEAADSEDSGAGEIGFGSFFEMAEAEIAKERKEVRKMIDKFKGMPSLDLFSEGTRIFDKGALDKVREGAEAIGEIVDKCSSLQDTLTGARKTPPSSTFKYFGEDNKTLLLDKDKILHPAPEGNP